MAVAYVVLVEYSVKWDISHQKQFWMKMHRNSKYACASVGVNVEVKGYSIFFICRVIFQIPFRCNFIDIFK